MSTDHAADEAGRPLRSDAARNRQLILETAASVFAEHGIDAGYDEIARRAGIGVGTVYRRFPERAELVLALFESRIGEVADMAEEAIGRADAWEALGWFLEKTLERQVADRGLKDVMMQTIGIGEHLSVPRDRLAPLFDTLVSRAKEHGGLRDDVAATDLGIQLASISSMISDQQPDLWRRYLALLLDGLRASAATAPLPLNAPTDESMPELMGRLHGR